MTTKAQAHRQTADRLLDEATERADNGDYTIAQTLLELSEAHLEAANRAELNLMVQDIGDHLAGHGDEPPC